MSRSLASTTPAAALLPEVTVVIPTRDRWPIVCGALKSAFIQERVRLEVIVVVDGSTDVTAEMLERVDDPRVRVIRNAESQGVAHARNQALERARGEWIAFLDDDDLWSPQFLRTAVDAARAEDAVLAYAATVILDGNRDPVKVLPVADPANLLRRLLLGNVVGAPCGVVLRTDVVRSVGGFDPKLSLRADWDLWIRVAREGRGAACTEVLVGYTRHGDNMHLVDVAAAGPELRYMARKHADLARQLRVPFGVRSYLKWASLTHRKAGRRLPAAAAYVRLGVLMRQPSDVARGIGMVLGERVMRLGQRPPEPTVAPEWVSLYREVPVPLRTRS
jgi:glycosyltransferase involved in cell wall biosynthesis